MYRSQRKYTHTESQLWGLIRSQSSLINVWEDPEWAGELGGEYEYQYDEDRSGGRKYGGLNGGGLWGPPDGTEILYKPEEVFDWLIENFGWTCRVCKNIREKSYWDRFPFLDPIPQELCLCTNYNYVEECRGCYRELHTARVCRECYEPFSVLHSNHRFKRDIKYEQTDDTFHQNCFALFILEKEIETRRKKRRDSLNL